MNQFTTPTAPTAEENAETYKNPISPHDLETAVMNSKLTSGLKGAIKGLIIKDGEYVDAINSFHDGQIANILTTEVWIMISEDRYGEEMEEEFQEDIEAELMKRHSAKCLNDLPKDVLDDLDNITKRYIEGEMLSLRVSDEDELKAIYEFLVSVSKGDNLVSTVMVSSLLEDHTSPTVPLAAVRMIEESAAKQAKEAGTPDSGK
jgi:hypothetical protein